MSEEHKVEQEQAVAPPETAGQRLRAARERAGWNQERLAGEMCLPVQRLQALEADRFEGFGGEVFVRGFLRRAAAVLGLPPDELVGAYAAASGARHPAEIVPELPPGRVPRGGLPGWSAPLGGAALVAAVLALAWWTLRPADAPETLPLAAEPAALPQPEPPAQAAPEPAVSALESVAVAETPVGAPAENEPAAPEALAAADAEAAATTPAPEAVLELPEPALELPVMAQLRFEFTDDCWVEVIDARDQRLAYRLYRAGDVARLSGVPPLAVFLGNAEGVRLTVDDEPVAVRPAATRNGTARLTVGGGTG